MNDSTLVLFARRSTLTATVVFSVFFWFEARGGTGGFQFQLVKPGHPGNLQISIECTGKSQTCNINLAQPVSTGGSYGGGYPAGFFRHELSRPEAENILQDLKEALKSYSPASRMLPDTATYSARLITEEENGTKSEKSAIWVAGGTDKKPRPLEKFFSNRFEKLYATALEKPDRVLKLHCTASAKERTLQGDCELTNVGKTNVVVPVILPNHLGVYEPGTNSSLIRLDPEVSGLSSGETLSPNESTSLSFKAPIHRGPAKEPSYVVALDLRNVETLPILLFSNRVGPGAKK